MKPSTFGNYEKIVTSLNNKIFLVTSEFKELYSMINIMAQTYFLAFTGGQNYKSDNKFTTLKKYLSNYDIFQTLLIMDTILGNLNLKFLVKKITFFSKGVEVKDSCPFISNCLFIKTKINSEISNTLNCLN